VYKYETSISQIVPSSNAIEKAIGSVAKRSLQARQATTTPKAVSTQRTHISRQTIRELPQLWQLLYDRRLS
jgi:hypothetical protein